MAFSTPRQIINNENIGKITKKPRRWNIDVKIGDF